MGPSSLFKGLENLVKSTVPQVNQNDIALPVPNYLWNNTLELYILRSPIESTFGNGEAVPSAFMDIGVSSITLHPRQQMGSSKNGN